MQSRLIQRLIGSTRNRPRLSRRELFQLGVAASGALLSAHASPLQGKAKPAIRRRVVVIGAGFSGLACAYELMSAGYEVKVIEARKRVGGRVLSLNNFIPGKNVEGGGELLGSNHPLVMAYAARFGFKFLDVSEEDAPSPMILGGRKLLGHEVEKISEEVEATYASMTDDARAVNEDEPWNTDNAVELDRQTTADWIGRQKISAVARALLTLEFTSDNGVATEMQSYLGNLAQVKGGGLEKYWEDTEVYRLRGGNQQYALRFARELGDERLILGSAVREVIASDSVMTVVDADGRKYESDDVVLAVPPSTWSLIRFTPELPKDLMPQMGANVKFLASLKSAFWRTEQLSPDANSDEKIGATWHGTDGQVAAKGADVGPVALVAFSGGPAANAIHRLSPADRQAEYLKEFETLYPGFGRQFLKGQMMDWIGDPWTRAGYSFPAPGQVTTIGPQLRKGIGRLHFAGEHCCYQFVGYMEGALRSGVDVAKRLAKRDGLTTKS